jgi:hypothetical protein
MNAPLFKIQLTKGIYIHTKIPSYALQQLPMGDAYTKLLNIPFENALQGDFCIE